MLYADLLHFLAPSVVEFVHVTVDVVEFDILIEVRLQVLHSGTLAHGLADTCYNEMAKNLVIYLVEANAIVNLIKYVPMPVDQQRVNIRQNAVSLFFLLPLFALVNEIHFKLATITAKPLAGLTA